MFKRKNKKQLPPTDEIIETYDECSICQRKLITVFEMFCGFCGYCNNERAHSAKAYKQKIYSRALSEACEDCGATIDHVISKNFLPTVCEKCAAKRYWALKDHIRNKLQYWRKLSIDDKIAIVHWQNLNYVNGITFERKLKHLLEDRGWYVMRSAGSHGIADLIAIQAGVTMIISCKRDFRDLVHVEPDKVKEILRVCGNDKYIIPIHARNFNRRTWLTDLRTGKDITTQVFHK